MTQRWIHYSSLLAASLVSVCLFGAGLLWADEPQQSPTEASQLARWAQYDKARDAYARSLAAAQQRKDRIEIGRQSLHLGMVIQALGDLDDSRTLYYKAAQHLQQVETVYHFGRSLIGLADVARYKGEFTLSEGLYQRVIAEVDDPFLQELAARHLARLWADQGRFQDAIELLEPRVGSRQVVLSRPDQLRSLRMLELAYNWNDQPQEARRIQQRTVNFWASWFRYRFEDGGTVEEPRDRVEQGVAQWRSGDVSTGRETLITALRDLRKSPDWHAHSWALMSLGDIARQQEEPQVAGRYYRKAQPMIDRINSLWRRIELLQRQAFLAESRQEWDAALGFLKTKERLLQEVEAKGLLPAVRLQQVRVLTDAGNPEMARPLAQQALRGCAQIKNTFGHIAALLALAEVETVLGETEMAEVHRKTAAELGQKQGYSSQLMQRLRSGENLPNIR